MQENKQEKSPIKQKILFYLAHKGVTPYEFYQKSGVTRGVLSQNNGISEENLTRFLAYAEGVSLQWLIKGVGDMFDQDILTPNEQIKHDLENRIKTENNYNQSVIDSLLNAMSAKDDIVRQQAEEIGRLKAEISQLHSRLEKSAVAANTNHTANAG